MIHSAFSVSNLCVKHGKITAVHGLSFDIPVGRSIGIVGHNGAGKSSTLMAVSGALTRGSQVSGHLQGPTSRHGDVRIDLSGSRSDDISVSLVPEKDKVFSLLTVHENLLAIRHTGPQENILIDDIYTFFPRLAERRTTIAGNLSGGEQQMLAIGTALLTQPRILMIDEPTLGLAVPVIETICEKLCELRTMLDLTLVVALAETGWASRLADSAFVLDCGEKISGYIPASDAMRDHLEQCMAGNGNSEASAHVDRPASLEATHA